MPEQLNINLYVMQAAAIVRLTPCLACQSCGASLEAPIAYAPSYSACMSDTEHITREWGIIDSVDLCLLTLPPRPELACYLCNCPKNPRDHAFVIAGLGGGEACASTVAVN